MNALDEVTPAFGVAKEELEQVVQNGIIHFDKIIDEILRSGQLFVDQVRTSTRTPLVSLLLHGPPGSGKTALAATIARASDYPFMKLVSPDDMVGFSEGQKVAAISKVFADSYKSPLSVVVVDSVERLLGGSLKDVYMLPSAYRLQISRPSDQGSRMPSCRPCWFCSRVDHLRAAGSSSF